MNPRAVQMAKAVVDSGLVDVELLGNVIAPFYKGWANNSANYFTLVGVGGWQAGNPFMGQPNVYGYKSDGTPLYRWFPVRASNFPSAYGAGTLRAIVSFTAQDPPPIGALT